MPETYKGGQGSPPTPGYDCAYPPYTGTGPSDGPTDRAHGPGRGPLRGLRPTQRLPSGDLLAGGRTKRARGPGGNRPIVPLSERLTIGLSACRGRALSPTLGC